MRTTVAQPPARRSLRLACVLLLAGTGFAGSTRPVAAEELPLTPDMPIEEFQNKAEMPSYDFDAPPRGIFRDIQVTEGFDEELGFRRSHEIVPVHPTDTFQPATPSVYVVFSLFQHYQAFQVIGQCFPEAVDGLDPATVVSQDAMYLALEDESGYLRFHAPEGGWKPGRYKVEIHVGWVVTAISLVGTMRFTVADPAHAHSVSK